MLALAIAPSAFSQETPISGHLRRFDNEHDYAKKEGLLRQITDDSPNAGPPFSILLNAPEIWTRAGWRCVDWRRFITSRAPNSSKPH